MDLIYIDESGDIGKVNSPTKEYLLVAMIVPHARWHELDQRLHEARRRMKLQLGLDTVAEIHAVEFLGGARIHLGLEAWQRVWTARWLLKEISRQREVRFIVLGRTKTETAEVFVDSWSGLATHLNGCLADKALMLTDVTDRNTLLQAIGRHAGAKNQVAGEKHYAFNLKLIEDPLHVDSKHSRMLQIVDLVAYLWRQKLRPNTFFQKEHPRELIRQVIRLTGPIDLR